jgi:hypothetical protein
MRKEPRDFAQADLEKSKLEQNQRDKVKSGYVFQSRYSGTKTNNKSPDSINSEITFTNDSYENIKPDNLKLDFNLDEQLGV